MSTRGCNVLHSNFLRYVTRNEAKELRGLVFHKKRLGKWKAHVTTWFIWRRVSYPQCFMFCGLSIRMASLILRSWSGQALVTVILWSSDCLGLLGVGWRTTCIKTERAQMSWLSIWHPGDECWTYSSKVCLKGQAILCVTVLFRFRFRLLYWSL